MLALVVVVLFEYRVRIFRIVNNARSQVAVAIVDAAAARVAAAQRCRSGRRTAVGAAVAPNRPAGRKHLRLIDTTAPIFDMVYIYRLCRICKGVARYTIVLPSRAGQMIDCGVANGRLPVRIDHLTVAPFHRCEAIAVRFAGLVLAHVAMAPQFGCGIMCRGTPV